jgi:hypothetical protein
MMVGLAEARKAPSLPIQGQRAQNVWAARKDDLLNEGQMQKRIRESMPNRDAGRISCLASVGRRRV